MRDKSLSLDQSSLMGRKINVIKKKEKNENEEKIENKLDHKSPVYVPQHLLFNKNKEIEEIEEIELPFRKGYIFFYSSSKKYQFDFKK